MKKDVKLEHKTLFKKFHQKPSNLIVIVSLSHELANKWERMTLLKG
jgi:hypothetical protein